MKRTILTISALIVGIGALAQQSGAPIPAAGRIHRTQIIPYDTRHEADARDRAGTAAYKPLTVDPQRFSDWEGQRLRVSADGTQLRQTVYGITRYAVVDIPYAWTDGEVFVHLENIGSAYTLRVGDQFIGGSGDGMSPADFCISQAVKEGRNELAITLEQSPAPQIDTNNKVPGKPFDGSYFYMQNKRSIADFEIALVPDSTRRFGVLELAIVAQNGFNYEETVTVGYDIYSPQGKLLEFNIQDVVIPGRSTDTVRFAPLIYHTYENKWEVGAKTIPLYKVMLFTRRDGAYREYMPLKIGFGKTELVDGRIMRLGKELKLDKAPYNAGADAKATLAELKALKAKGKNTICPDYPQPAWFYELCDELGLYVIDCANINAPDRRDERTVGGTPSNDPTLANEYLERVKAMYYRSRNFTCVIAFALGAPSGNGYNMYKAYEWLKSVETSRPVIYVDARGEWNTDL